MDDYYFEHSWKLKLRQLGRHMRKIWSTTKTTMLRKKRRAGYTRFHSEEEQQVRFNIFSMSMRRYIYVDGNDDIYNRYDTFNCLGYGGYYNIDKGWRVMNSTFPPGLLSLMPFDKVFVDRENDGLEVLREWENEKRYKIMDAHGNQLFTAFEESSQCARCCFGTGRSWIFHVLDNNQREVFRISRKFRCTSSCFPCCLQILTVHADGNLLGSVTQNWNILRPSFTVRDADGAPVLIMKGPICMPCFSEVDFIIKSVDKKHNIGVITKKWTGLAREIFKIGNSFGLGFPTDLDVKIKAVLIGACILVDFVYFEEQTNMNRLIKYD